MEKRLGKLPDREVERMERDRQMNRQTQNGKRQTDEQTERTKRDRQMKRQAERDRERTKRG